jgi:hypothetical protein
MISFNDKIRGKLITYFIHKLDVKPHKTGWLIRGTCPDCGATKKFGVNIYTNWTHCFKCEFKKQPLRLLMQLENLTTFPATFKFLESFHEAELTEKVPELLTAKKSTLPESYKLISIGTSTVAKIAQRYMKKRGYNLMYLSMKGVGYCTSGKYAHRIIIPYYENGEVVYFNAREFINTGFRHLNPDVDEFGLGKSMLIYNVDCLKIYKRVYMLESATNSLTMGDRAFGIGGKVASDYQISKIIRSPAKEVVIILDPDAYYESLKAGLKLVLHKKVKVVKLPKVPDGKGKFKDVNDFGKLETLKYVKETPWQSYSMIYKEFIRTPKPSNFVLKAQ